MKKTLFFLLKFYLFWYILFLVNRILFSLFYIEGVSKSDFLEILQIIPNSFRLDLSTTSYFAGIPTLILFIISFIPYSKIHLYSFKLFTVINLLLVIISAMIIGGETALYSEWNTKLNFKALSHFSNPSEVVSTASWGNIGIFSFYLVVEFSLFYFLHKKFFKNEDFKQLPVNVYSILKNIIFFPILFGLIVLMLRGGVQKIPINTSDAYFSTNLILNDITVNPNWNVFNSIIKSKKNFKGNPYEKHPAQEASSFLKDLYATEKDSTTSILTTNRPNVVFIILEGWSADNIQTLGGYEGVTPNFESLTKEGFLFKEFYSAGWTSDQGIASILSSFPVFPHVAIINQPAKARRLSCINKNLEKEGYNSSFFFGGQLTYGNIKGYLISQGVQKVKDEEDYPSDLPKASLGIHDEYMFQEYHQEINQLKEPFLTNLFTLSSHAPYDIPKDMGIDWGEDQNDYINSIAYSDSCLGNFMESVKKEAWYKNTLFVMVADHSHNTPKKWRHSSKEQLKIPMLWFGDVIKPEFKGKGHNKIGSHLDIGKTLLAQLQINADEYKWGKNLLNPYSKEFAPYAFHRGYAWIRPNGYFSFDENYQNYNEKHAENDSTLNNLIKEGEMFFQQSFGEYLSY